MSYQKNPQEIRICPVCGTSFLALTINHKYCCVKCRDRRKSIGKIKIKMEIKEAKKKLNEINRINREAFPIGLSYGKYVAMTERGAKYEIKERVRG